MNRYAILVLGIARSGTSALAGTLSEIGIAFGSGLKAIDWQNPKGNFEHKELSQANQRVLTAVGSSWSDHRALKSDWRLSEQVKAEEECIEQLIKTEFANFQVFGLKDPRLVPLFPLYVDVLSKLSIQPVVISISRDKEEVISSIDQSGYYHGSFSYRRGESLFEHYRKQIDIIHDNYGGVSVTFDDLLYKTNASLKHIEINLRDIFSEPLEMIFAGNPERPLDPNKPTFIDIGLHRSHKL